MMPFIDELALATKAERARLLAAPAIGEGPSGRLTCSNYLSFLTQAYSYVSRTTAVPRAVAARLPARHQGLRQVVSSYGDELAVRAGMLLENIVTLGGEVSATCACPPAPETTALIHHALDIAGHGDGIGILGLIYVAEGTVASLAAIAADRLQVTLQLPREAVTYLNRSHQAFDPAPMRRREALLNCIIRPDDRAAVARSAKSSFDLYAAVLQWPNRQSVASHLVRHAANG